MSKTTAALTALAILAGAGSLAALPAAAAVTVTRDDARPTINSTIKELLTNPATAAVLEKHLPGISSHPSRPQFEGMTLAQLVPVSQGQVTAEMVAAIDADLKALPAG
ncbi:hypothetical protein GVN24_34395 [Rhizobium sp. CRIBSB]|nr:hypothetical protein [Rhizobium sp. CRIBSB]